MKTEVDKLGINKYVNVPTSLNNLKPKVDDLNVVKLKTVCSILKELSDLVKKEVAKNAKFDMPNAKVNDLENKINGATNLIHINQ